MMLGQRWTVTVTGRIDNGRGAVRQSHPGYGWREGAERFPGIEIPGTAHIGANRQLAWQFWACGLAEKMRRQPQRNLGDLGGTHSCSRQHHGD